MLAALSRLLLLLLLPPIMSDFRLNRPAEEEDGEEGEEEVAPEELAR